MVLPITKDKISKRKTLVVILDVKKRMVVMIIDVIGEMTEHQLKNEEIRREERGNSF
jgi:hypothetical protein